MIHLSIITINYNNALGLLKTIESVLSQTNKEFEYIVIDGGSTDESLEVIKRNTSLPPKVHSSVYKSNTNSLSDNKLNTISYWSSEPDTGIYNAMNKGILVAKGKYCQFLNSGDYFVSSDIIDKVFKNIPDCSIFYGNMLKLLQNGKVYRDKCEQGKISMLTLYKGTLNHSPAFIKRSLFEKYGLYDETLKIVSDWKWYLIAIGVNNEKVKYINLDITYFNMDGISNTNHRLEIQERRLVLEEIIPANVLIDYDNYWLNIEQLRRVNKYNLTRWLFIFIERIIFKCERFLSEIQLKS